MRATTFSLATIAVLLCSIEGVWCYGDSFTALIASSACALVMLVIALIMSGVVYMWKEIIEDYYRKRGFSKCPPPHRRSCLRGHHHVTMSHASSISTVPRREAHEPFSVVWQDRDHLSPPPEIRLVTPPFQDDIMGYGEPLDYYNARQHPHPAHPPLQMNAIDDGKQSTHSSVAQKSTLPATSDHIGYYVEGTGAAPSASGSLYTPPSENTAQRPTSENISVDKESPHHYGGRSAVEGEMTEIVREDDKVTPF